MERSEIRILVVDDEETERVSYAAALGQAGLKAEVVASAHEARQKALQKPYHLILIDLDLADGTAFETIDHLAAAGRRPSVILTTAHPSVTTATEGMRRGARNYLAKPVNGPELIQAVEAVLTSDGLLIDSDRQFLLELGRRLRIARQQANLTMRQVGARIHISQAQISQIEAGLSAPSLTTLFRLARALRVRLSDLMKGF